MAFRSPFYAKVITSACVFSLSALLGAMSASPAYAGDGAALASAVQEESLPEKKRTKLGLYLTAVEAGELLATRDDILFIDVRTRAEVTFVGLAERVDKIIPYMVMDEFWEFDEQSESYKLVVNSNFAAQVAALVSERGLDKSAMLILVCRSGSRSAKAANLLNDLGYANVYSVIDGFEGDKGDTGARDVNGWRNAGLTWSYSIRPEQAYAGSF